MPLYVKDLKTNTMYYWVGIAPDPMDLVVSTWVFVQEKYKGEYGFCEWWQYHHAKDKSAVPLSHHRPEADQNGDLWFPSFCLKEELVGAINDNLEDFEEEMEAE